MDLRFSARTEQVQTTSLSQKIYLGIKVSDFLDLSPENYQKIIKELENSDIFMKFSIPGEYNVIEVKPVKKYIPFSHPANDADKKMQAEVQDSIPGYGLESQEPDLDMDIESMLEKSFKGETRILLDKIKTMKKDLFYYYFILGEGTDAEICSLLKITHGDLNYLRTVFDEALLTVSMGMKESSRQLDPDYLKSEVIAEVFLTRDLIQVMHTKERSRYNINQERLTELLKQKKIKQSEMKKLRKMLEKMQMINYSLNLLQEITDMIIRHQKDFLFSGKDDDLKAIEEKEIASLTGVDTSWISKLVGGKRIKRYIKVRNKLIFIRDLFISRRQLNKKMGMKLLQMTLQDGNINKRIKDRKNRSTDEEIVQKINKMYGFKVSRRTLNNWRRELISGKK